MPEQPKNADGHKKSAYGGGFVFRMLILLVLLALVIGGFYYDTKVLIPQAGKTIDKTINLTTEETDDGHGLPKDKVQETIGFAPSQTRVEGEYEIETYRFRRLLPFAKGEYLEVVYENGALARIFANEQFTPSRMKHELLISPSGRDAPMSPMAGGAAPSPPDNDKSDTVGGVDENNPTDINKDDDQAAKDAEQAAKDAELLKKFEKGGSDDDAAGDDDAAKDDDGDDKDDAADDDKDDDDDKGNSTDDESDDGGDAGSDDDSDGI